MPQGPANSPSERIFISIAAFRDPETRWTVKDLLRKASKPDRLRIAIVWQVDTASESDIMELPVSASQKSQVRCWLHLVYATEDFINWKFPKVCQI